MIRLNLSYWYELGTAIHPLTELYGDQKLSEIILKMHDAYKSLVLMIELGMLRNSLKHAEILKQLIEKYLGIYNDSSTIINHPDVSTVRTYAYEFETIYKSELSIEPVYIVTPKGGFNVDILTENPYQIFNPLLSHISEVEYDVKQAARSLAFELPTAAAFHLHRICEAVIRRYWKIVYNREPLENSTIGGSATRPLYCKKIYEPTFA